MLRDMSFIMIDRVRARERGDLGDYLVVHATAAAIADERLHTGAGHRRRGARSALGERDLQHRQLGLL